MNYTCHSGGCSGSDMAWEMMGEEYGVNTIAYSFQGHTQYGKNPKKLTVTELNEGFQHVLEANKTLKRKPEMTPRYIQCLLSRNWFQIKNSDSVFAIGKSSIDRKIVSGGTGWAVQMAIDNNKTIFFFDQPTKTWNKFNYDTMSFDVIDYVPKLTENFAGIGTREINDDGLKAIDDVFKMNFGGEEEQQTRDPVTIEIAGAAPVTPANCSLV